MSRTGERLSSARIASQLVVTALQAAKRAEAPAVEADPLDAELITGYATTRRIQDSRSPSVALPDHAPRSESNRTMKLPDSRAENRRKPTLKIRYRGPWAL
jgi:hypothetical protein